MIFTQKWLIKDKDGVQHTAYRPGLDGWDRESKNANKLVINDSTLIRNIAIFQRCQ